jgi:hypothetical protein
MDDKRKIEKFCRSVAYPNEILPVGEYIMEGVWLIATAIPLEFTQVCRKGAAQSSRSIQVTPPLSVVELDDACVATNNYLTLPSYQHLTSTVKPRQNMKLIRGDLNFTNIKLWEPFNRALPNLNLTYHEEALEDIRLWIPLSWLGNYRTWRK